MYYRFSPADLDRSVVLIRTQSDGSITIYPGRLVGLQYSTVECSVLVEIASGQVVDGGHQECYRDYDVPGVIRKLVRDLTVPAQVEAEAPEVGVGE